MWSLSRNKNHNGRSCPLRPARKGRLCRPAISGRSSLDDQVITAIEGLLQN
jgi:hypothetical protein